MTDHTSAAPRRTGPRAGTVAGIAGGALVLLLAGGYGVAYALAGNTLAPKTTVAGIEVGGLDPAAAQTKLAAELGARAAAPLTITAGDASVELSPEALGLSVDYEASIRAAGGAKSFDPRVIWDNLTGGRAHEAVVKLDPAAAEAALAGLGEQVHTDPEDASLAIVDGKPKLTEAKPGAELVGPDTAVAAQRAYLHATQVDAVVTAKDAEITTAEAQQALSQIAEPALASPITIAAGEKKFEIAPATMASVLSFVADGGALTPKIDGKKLADASAKKFTELGMQAAKDASFTFTDGKPAVVPSVDGVGVSQENLVKAVESTMTKASGREASVEVGPVKASFTTEDADKLGVKEITGEFTTAFPATAYRVNNIGKSASLVNGVLVKPGETFSMNKVLGERTLANGWQAGGAIDGGKVVQRMGGGISQTTTTTFNAIFFAGLEDVYHKPHSLYFSRYPLGREATLDYVSVDMKFKNNTDYGVVMQAFTNNPKVGGQGTVTVRVWSTKVYDVKASDPVKSNIKSPGPAIQSDAAVCSPQSAMSGFRVDYNRLFYKDGALVKTEPFDWTYNTLQAVTCTNPNARADRIER